MLLTSSRSSRKYIEQNIHQGLGLAPSPKRSVPIPVERKRVRRTSFESLLFIQGAVRLSRSSLPATKLCSSWRVSPSKVGEAKTYH